MEVSSVAEPTREELYRYMVIMLSADKATQDRIIRQICKKTGFGREKVEHILDAVHQVLQKDIPIN